MSPLGFRWIKGFSCIIYYVAAPRVREHRSFIYAVCRTYTHIWQLSCLWLWSVNVPLRGQVRLYLDLSNLQLQAGWAYHSQNWKVHINSQVLILFLFWLTATEEVERMKGKVAQRRHRHHICTQPHLCDSSSCRKYCPSSVFNEYSQSHRMKEYKNNRKWILLYIQTTIYATVTTRKSGGVTGIWKVWRQMCRVAYRGLAVSVIQGKPSAFASKYWPFRDKSLWSHWLSLIWSYH